MGVSNSNLAGPKLTIADHYPKSFWRFYKDSAEMVVDLLNQPHIVCSVCSKYFLLEADPSLIDFVAVCARMCVCVCVCVFRCNYFCRDNPRRDGDHDASLSH